MQRDPTQTAELAASRWLVGFAGLVLAPVSALGTWRLVFIAPRLKSLLDFAAARFAWLLIPLIFPYLAAVV